MKRQVFVLVCLLLCMRAGAQVSDTIDYSVPIAPIKYAGDLKLQDEFIYLSGITYETKLNDGFSTYAYLNKYDKTLQLNWSLKFDSTKKSAVTGISFVRKKIFALVQHGESTAYSSDTFLMLYTISPDGKVLEKKYIGPSFGYPTGILTEKKQLWFAYTSSASIYYSGGNVLKTILVQYDLATGTLKTWPGETPACRPYYVLGTSASGICVLGEYDKNLEDTPQEQFVLQLRNNQIRETILPSNKSEYILGSYAAKNEMVLFTQFPGVYGDFNKYVKITTLNTESGKVNTAYTYFKDTRWEEMSLGGYIANGSIWVIAKNQGQPGSCYLNINNQGKEVAAIPTRPIGTNIAVFIIEKNRQIQVADGRLKITHEKMKQLPVTEN